MYHLCSLLIFSKNSRMHYTYYTRIDSKTKNILDVQLAGHFASYMVTRMRQLMVSSRDRFRSDNFDC